MHKAPLTKADFDKLLDLIARELPSGAYAWAVKPRRRDDDEYDRTEARMKYGTLVYRTLDDPTGPEISVSADGYGNEGKLSISGSFPTDYRPYNESYSITVSHARGAKVIAKEIERRLLPKWLPKAHEALAKKAAWEAEKATRENLARAFAKYIGGKVEGRDSFGFYLTDKNYSRRIEGKVSDNRVELTVSNLEPETARELLAYLKNRGLIPGARRCPLCLDVPGKNGLGYPCNGCAGTGYEKEEA